MASSPVTLADRFAGLRSALQQRRGELRPDSGAIDAMLLALFVALLGRLERLARAWHPAGTPEEGDQDRLVFRLPPDLRYLLGPRRNRGMRPRPRTSPIACPRTARAPPRGVPARLPPLRWRNTVAPATPRGTRGILGPPHLLAVLLALPGCAMRPDGSMGLACTPRDERSQSAPSSSGGPSALASIAFYAAMTGLCMASR